MQIFEIVKLAFRLMRKGAEITEPGPLKDAASFGSWVAGVLTISTAIARSLGYEIGVSDEKLIQWGLGFGVVFFPVTGWLHVATSARAGLPARPEPPILTDRIDVPAESATGVEPVRRDVTRPVESGTAEFVRQRESADRAVRNALDNPY